MFITKLSVVSKVPVVLPYNVTLYLPSVAYLWGILLFASPNERLVTFPSPKFIHPESKSPIIVQLKWIFSFTSTVVGLAFRSTSKSTESPNLVKSAINIIATSIIAKIWLTLGLFDLFMLNILSLFKVVIFNPFYYFNYWFLSNFQWSRNFLSFLINIIELIEN